MTPSVRQGTSARHAQVTSLVESGVTQVGDIAQTLDVSESTVRRDLAHLTQTGRLVRTYGGAAVQRAFHERSIDDSAGIRYPAKKAIATTAAELVGDDQVIFIDAGTTCAAMGSQLHGKQNLTVVTRGLETAYALVNMPGITVMMLGGTLRKLSHGLIGPLAQLALERLRFDLAFLGADAVDPLGGIGEPTLEETIVKEQVAAASSAVYVLADSTKITGSHPPAWTSLDTPWSLITDADVSSAVLKHFQSADRGVLIAQY